MFDVDQLALAARSGGEREFEALYRATYAQVFGYLYHRTGSVETAEDLATEVYTDIYRSLGRFEPRFAGSFRAWLYGVARSKAIDRQRKEAREKVTMLETADLVAASDRSLGSPSDPTAEAALLAGADPTELVQMIGELPESQRDCLLLRFGSDLSVAETASAMGKTADAVKQLQHRAIRNLRAKLDGGER